MRTLVLMAALLAACSASKRPLTAEDIAKERQASADFLRRAASEAGAERMSSGAVFREVAPGRGVEPRPTDTVTFRYLAERRDGTRIDGTDSLPVPPTVALGRLSPCFAEALQRMRAGARGRLVCPSALVYGEAPVAGIIPGSVILVDLELLDVGRPLPPPGH